MRKLLNRWGEVREDEFPLFAWTATLLFLLYGSSIVLENYAEMTFLKRYGVEFLPLVNMLNAFLTFGTMGLLTVFSRKMAGARLLRYLFLFCGLSVAVIRALIPLGIDLVYPVLFMLKAQYPVLQGLLFWNLANDLFNTRQSKRLFPLITAVGVVGQALGSFGTPWVADLLRFDNLLLFYLVLCVLAAATVNVMVFRFPGAVLADEQDVKAAENRGKTSLKDILPMMRESILLKILVILTLMPNIVIPIMNYQFNFAVDQHFASETGLLTFFGYFKGFLRVVSLFLLLFVGKLYNKWGLPVALMFHPLNYMLVFCAFLFKFDYISAMYSRLTTGVLRTSINVPATNILYGLFPEEYRAAVRPFLRGVVVRVGLFVGSGIILVSERLFHPKYLSLVGLPFVVCWVLGPYVLKRNYAKILLGLVARNVLDLKTMEREDVIHLFSDSRTREELIRGFAAAEGKECLWYGELLRTLSIERLDSHILASFDQATDDETRIGLLGLLSAEAGAEALEVLRGLTDPERPELTAAIVKAVDRIAPDGAGDFLREILAGGHGLAVRAHVIAGLHRREPERFGETIDAWLASQEVQEVRAGIAAAGGSGDAAYVPRLIGLLQGSDDEGIQAACLRALRQLDCPDLNALVIPRLAHPGEAVRAAALDAVRVTDVPSLEAVILRMGDASDSLHDRAKDMVAEAGFLDLAVLLRSLDLPRRRIREGVLDVLETLEVKGVEVVNFARSHLGNAYRHLAERQAAALLPECEARELLVQHLGQREQRQVETVVRVLAAQDRSGRVRLMWRGLFSGNPRQKANSIEAVNDLLEKSLAHLLLPLLEDGDVEVRLNTGRRNFNLPDFGADRDRLLEHLLRDGDDWVTVLLALNVALRCGVPIRDATLLETLDAPALQPVRDLARQVLGRQRSDAAGKETEMESVISVPDRILLLRRVEIFEGLEIGELAAVAAVVEEATAAPGEDIIREGDHGDTLYLIAKGEVSVHVGEATAHAVTLDRMGEGDYFGEMALFEDEPRSATIRAEAQCLLLLLHKQEIQEIVREYPQIALHVCRVLSGRIRKLHKKVTTCSVWDGSGAGPEPAAST